MSQHKIVVLGSGKVGRLVTWLLADTGDYTVTAVDQTEEAAQEAVTDTSGQPIPGTEARTADIGDQTQVERVIDGAEYVLSCAPYHCNVAIAKAAKACGTHYLDLTEDVATTKAVSELAAGAERAFIPQCGLAPGFITIVANDLAQEFDELETLKMRVGALPLYPHNRLNYNVTWNTVGLVNEYRHPCEAVRNGELVALSPLENLETITIDGLEYEAFNTSGGLGTMASTFAGRVRNMDYKSIRYPGHRDILKILMEDLRLRDDPDTMVKIFEHALPHTDQDVVLIVVTATGRKDGQLTQHSYVKKIYSAKLGGRRWGAIQITTASGLCGVLDLHVQGALPAAGFVRQEQVPLDAFLGNRLGKYYA